MARKEKPVDPAGGPLADFARDLRELRARAGNLSYRVMAKRAGYAASTLSVAASGTMLPSIEVTLAYVQVCGGDADAWRARWHRLAAQLSHQVNDAVPDYANHVEPAVDHGRLTAVLQPPGAGRRRRMRAPAWILSLVAAVVALVLILGIAAFRSIGASHPQALNSAAVPVSERSCGGDYDVLSPSAAPNSPPALPATLPGDVQQLPGEFSPGAPAGGPLVPAAGYRRGVLYDNRAVNSIAASLTDVTGDAYDDPSEHNTGDAAFMFVTIGTPKPDQCWELLAYEALANMFGGGQWAGIETVTPGPLLTAAHAVLECGQIADQPDICAWAGPGPAGGEPVFGAIDMAYIPKAHPTYAAMAAFCDKVYAALTGP